MSIASEITRLQGVKSDILTSISDKGVTVPVGSALDDCPGLIADIPTGPSIDGVLLGGDVYKTVTIGTQTWLKSNFRYLDENINISSDLSIVDSPAVAMFSAKGSCGVLYNMAAVWYIKQNIATIAPGWRVPEYGDYKTLKNYLGSDYIQKLGKPVSWAPNWNVNGSSGFDLLPCGVGVSGSIYNNLRNCYLWSEVTSATNGYYWKNGFYTDGTINFSMINDLAGKEWFATLRLIKTT